MAPKFAYLSPRGHQIAFVTDVPSIPTITMELYPKWYGLIVIHPTGNIEEVPFPSRPDAERDRNESDYRDHIPNPKAVMWYASSKGYHIDSLALELLVGRWEIESMNSYDAAISKYDIV